MKKIEAIFRPFKLDEVYRSLARIGVNPVRATLEAARGTGRQGEITELHDGTVHIFDGTSMLRLELVVTDRQVPTVRDVITTAARTGQIGDGKLIISSVADVVRHLKVERNARDAMSSERSLKEGSIQ